MPDGEARVPWRAVVAFYALACAWSWPFFWWRDVHDWTGLAAPGYVRAGLIMVGPALAAFVCFRAFRAPRRTVTLLGTSPGKSLLFWTLPFPALAAAGALAPDGGLVPGTLLVLLVPLVLMLGEELGWRGFLQDALRPLPPLARYGLVAVLWEAWHFTTRTAGRAPARAAVVVAVFLVLGFLFSFGLGAAVERTRSVLVAAALHLAIDVVFETLDGGGDPAVYVAMAVVGVGWAFLLLLWDRPWPVLR